MKIRGLLLIAALPLVAGVTYAGLVQPSPVVVDLVNRTALGDMVTARFSDNDVEFIGCGVRYIDDGTGNLFAFGFCQAGDSDENQIACFTEAESLLETIRASADFSFISFSWDDEVGGPVCIRVGFSTQSFYIPVGVGEDDAFENHTHEYLTGKGNGQNNTSANTSPPSGGE